MAAKRLWSELYRPKTLDEYVFQNDKQREQIKEWVAQGDIPHLLLTGTPGSGKSTIGQILINHLDIDDADVMRENASRKTGIDFYRDEVTSFASSYPLSKFKIVVLEEFDRVSPQGQDLLKDVIESSSDTCRFICTSNHENRITPAIKSRFQHLRFKAPIRDDVLLRMAEMLIAENVEFEPEVLDKFISQAYPDIRKIINNLQLNVVGGKLTEPTHDSEGSDYLFKLVDLISEGDVAQIRKIVLENTTGEQLEEVYEFLYKNLHLHPKCKDKSLYEQALLVLLDGVYKHGLVAIPHLNFEATCIKLNQVMS